MERKYSMEIEGLMVEITYDFTKGWEGDYWTAPTEDRVKILGWSLRDESREKYLDYDDEEWEAWMQDIGRYVYNDSKWDIIEFEHENEDLL